MANLYTRTGMLKFLKENWIHWDSETMDIRKMHDGYGFHLYVAINNKLLYQNITTSDTLKDLKKLEDNRIFKIEKIIKSLL